MSDEITFRIAPAISALKARIESHAWFADITVITEVKGNIENDIAVALGMLTEKDEKIGVCIVILTPRAKNPSPNAPGPSIEPQFVLAVMENVTVNQGDNGTNKSALQIVEMLLRRIHHYNATTLNAAFTADATPFKLTNSEPLTYEVYFNSKLALKPEP